MNGANDHDSIINLIPAYALQALDVDEAELVASHLAACSHCQKELAAYERVVAAIPAALPVVEPAPALKTQVMQQIQASQTPAPAAPEPATSRLATIDRALHDFFTGPIWRPLLLGLVLLVLLLNLGIWLQGNRTAESTFTELQMTPTEAAPEATGLIVISEDGEYGALIVDKLPQLDKEKEQYQLWLIKDGERTSGGVFSVYDSGYKSISVESPEPLGSYTSFGITVEPAGGSPGPTGVRVLEYNL